MIFRRKKTTYVDPAEERLDQIVVLIKDLPRADYKRLCEAMDLVYNGFQKIKKVKTEDERENEDLDTAEKILNKEEAKQ